MSRAAWTSPTRIAVLAAALLVATAGFLAFSAPAAAAKPCWKQVIDDWLDNGRIDGIYASRCLEEARKNLPEDIRAYSDIEEKIDAALLDDARALAGVGGGAKNATRPNISRAEAAEIAKTLQDEAEDEEGVITKALNPTQTSADSFPLPLLILVGLALTLLTAGAAGFTHRKLAARRVPPR